MTKEQVAQARRLADDLDMEPSHAGVNQAGETMGRLLDEREALLEALKMIAPDGGRYEPPAGTGLLELRTKLTREDWRRMQVAIAKAEAE